MLTSNNRAQLKEYWNEHPEEFQAKGNSIYEKIVLPNLIGTSAYQDGHVVALDIETMDYVVHADGAMATTLVLDRHPGALIWRKRIGYKTVHRWGGGDWRETSNGRKNELETGTHN